MEKLEEVGMYENCKEEVKEKYREKNFHNSCQTCT